jgi:hypothetical protein
MKARFENSGIGSSKPTFLAMMSTTTSAAIRRPAAILRVMSFVDATTNTMPQKADPRSAVDQEPLSTFHYQLMDNKNELLQGLIENSPGGGKGYIFQFCIYICLDFRKSILKGSSVEAL